MSVENLKTNLIIFSLVLIITKALVLKEPDHGLGTEFGRNKPLISNYMSKDRILVNRGLSPSISSVNDKERKLAKKVTDEEMGFSIFILCIDFIAILLCLTCMCVDKPEPRILTNEHVKDDQELFQLLTMKLKRAKSGPLAVAANLYRKSRTLRGHDNKPISIDTLKTIIKKYGKDRVYTIIMKQGEKKGNISYSRKAFEEEFQRIKNVVETKKLLYMSLLKQGKPLERQLVADARDYLLKYKHIDLAEVSHAAKKVINQISKNSNHYLRFVLFGKHK